MANHEINNPRAIAQPCNSLAVGISDTHVLYYLHRSFQIGYERKPDALLRFLKVSRLIAWKNANIDSEDRKSIGGEHLFRILVAHRSPLKPLWDDPIGRHN